MNSLMTSGGWLPLPDVAVAVFPWLSVTVRVTWSGCSAPVSVLPDKPHWSEKENRGLEPLCVNVFAVSYVYWTVQSYDTRPFVPSGNDVDSTTQVVVLPADPRIRHSVVGDPPLVPGSSRLNRTTILEFGGAAAP